MERTLLHHWVATVFGRPYSPTIWSACHEEHPDALPRWARLEEGFVGHVHRWLNLGVWAPERWSLIQSGIDRDVLQTEARQLLKQQIHTIQLR